MNKERNTLGMTGGLNRSLGIKWKQFTNGAEPPILHGGLDIDGDGNENILYGYGGKLYLGDPTTGGNIWETKVLDIQRILGVESIL
jgi:outer membrane protein assembly factor BamB